MEYRMTKPIVGIITDRQQIGSHWHHTVMEKYIVAVMDAVDGLPFLIPAMGEFFDFEILVESLDGLLLTGGYSNIEPHHYGDFKSYEGCLHDSHRDATTLPLIPTAIDKEVPILGICRGLQELNVAFGGSLHQKIHNIPEFNDHREDKSQPLNVQYAPTHEVNLVGGGILSELSDGRTQMVNSLHEQGIDRLADNLIVEAVSSDGVIEAVRIKESKSFALAVQWHPEWDYQNHTFYRNLFKAFGQACKLRALGRNRVLNG
jgi:putative glutamine amidotransferase